MFNDCEITKEVDGGMKIDMKKYMSTIEAIYIDMRRKTDQLSKAHQDEITMYRKLAGSLFGLEQESCPEQPLLDQ